MIWGLDGDLLVGLCADRSFRWCLLGKGVGTCRRLVEVEAWGLSGQTFPVGFAVGRLRFRMAGAAETRSVTGKVIL